MAKASVVEIKDSPLRPCWLNRWYQKLAKIIFLNFPFPHYNFRRKITIDELQFGT